MSKTGELISCHFKDIAFVAVWSVLKWRCVTETNVGLINRPSPAGVPHLFVLHFSPRWWRFQGDPQGRAARRRFAFAAGCGQGKLVPTFSACLTFRTAFLCPSPGCWLPARPWGSRNCMGICGIQLLWGGEGREERQTFATPDLEQTRCHWSHFQKRCCSSALTDPSWSTELSTRDLPAPGRERSVTQWMQIISSFFYLEFHVVETSPPAAKSVEGGRRVVGEAEALPIWFHPRGCWHNLCLLFKKAGLSVRNCHAG